MYNTFETGEVGALRAVIHITEQFGLIALTVIPSRENLFAHQTGFATFWVCSILNMLITTWLNYRTVKKSSSPVSESSKFKEALNLRIACTSTHLISSVFALFWYVAHEKWCQDYSYSYFAISEWVVVWSNIYFHLAEGLDAKDIIVIWKNVGGN